MPTVDDLARRLLRLRPVGAPYIIGLTGGVACGKSTLAASLAASFSNLNDRLTVERVGTDGFLHPNAVLAARGVLDRKGFPETYDRAGLLAALSQARAGAAEFPGYSHKLYDIDPGLSRTLNHPDILLVEGLGLDASLPFDALIYLDATRADQEAWYVTRFIGFCEQARDDDQSFYARFRHLDPVAVRRLAADVWRQVNLPNLEAHIEPVRKQADLVVRKRSDHSISSIRAYRSRAPRLADAQPAPTPR